MPKVLKLFQFAPSAPHVAGATAWSADTPCPIASLIILPFNARLEITTTDKMIWVRMPYQDYEIEYIVTFDLFKCVGWTRREESFTVTIWDSKTKCTFLIPGLNSNV